MPLLPTKCHNFSVVYYNSPSIQFIWVMSDISRISMSSLEFMMLKYISKFGKPSMGHRTGKGRFSYQSQRRTVPMNVQTTILLCSFHTLARSCSKSFKQAFNSTSTENFQMYSWIQKMQRSQKSNCPHPLDHRKTKKIPEKHLPLLH